MCVTLVFLPVSPDVKGFKICDIRLRLVCVMLVQFKVHLRHTLLIRATNDFTDASLCTLRLQKPRKEGGQQLLSLCPWWRWVRWGWRRTGAVVELGKVTGHNSNHAGVTKRANNLLLSIEVISSDDCLPVWSCWQDPMFIEQGIPPWCKEVKHCQQRLT